MKILVTGGAGYVGYHVTKQLLEAQHTVTVLDSLAFGQTTLASFKRLRNFTFQKGDIGDLKAIVPAVKGQDAVIDLAAIVGDPACDLDPDETIRTNYLATKALISVSEYYGIKRLVFASSCSVYGDTKNKIADEKFPVNPLSLYAQTRVMSEELLLKGKKSITPVILRLSTVFGYSKRMRFDLVVNFLTAKAYFDKAFTIFGGDQWRPNVHVQDAARAFVTACLSPQSHVKGHIFNVGSEENNLTVDEIGEIIAQVIPRVSISRKKNVEDKRNYRVDFSKIKKQLNFTGDTSVKDGVYELVNIFHRQPKLNFGDDQYYNVKYLYKNRK